MECSRRISRSWTFIKFDRENHTWQTICDLKFEAKVNFREALQRGRADITRQLKSILSEVWHDSLVYDMPNGMRSEYDKKSPASFKQFVSTLQSYRGFAILAIQDFENELLMKLLAHGSSHQVADVVSNVCAYTSFVVDGYADCEFEFECSDSDDDSAKMNA